MNRTNRAVLGSLLILAINAVTALCTTTGRDLQDNVIFAGGTVVGVGLVYLLALTDTGRKPPHPPALPMGMPPRPPRPRRNGSANINPEPTGPKPPAPPNPPPLKKEPA